MLSRTAAVLMSTSHAGTSAGAIGARHQPHRNHSRERTGQREAHFARLVRRIEREHAIDRLRRVGRVQRRENEVARVRGLQRRIERFEISNFADEDDVGVLTQHAAKGLTERRRVGADLTLVDVRVHVTMEELDRVLDRDDVGAAILIDVLDHRRQRRRLARAGNSRDEDETTRLHRDLLEHRGQAQLADRLRLIRDGPHRVAEGAALLIQVDAEPSDARYTDREVAFLLFGEHVDLARRHQLLGEGFEILGTERADD
jgi:hypothetical protein